MSQSPHQFQPQGYGQPGYAPQQPQAPGGGGSAIKIILIIVGVLLVVGLLLCGVLAALLIPAVGAARQAATRMVDQNNLKLVGLAIHNYEATYKRMPAPAAINREGQDVWTGFVGLLPFQTEGQLYEQILKLEMTPWDQPQNSVLQGSSPTWLQSARAKLPPGSNLRNTFFIAAPKSNNGPDPAFVYGAYSKFADITDGTSNTIFAIQLVNHSVPWASPASLTPDEVCTLILNEDNHFLALLGDGSVVALPTSIDEATLRALLTRNGAEVVDLSTIALPGPR